MTELLNHAKEMKSEGSKLKALELIGRAVGMFTDKVEIKQTAMSDAEVEQRIKDKLNKFMGVIDVIDVATSPDDIPETPNEPVQADNADQA